MLPEEWWQASPNDSAMEVARGLHSVAASIHRTASDCLLFADLINEDVASDLAAIAEGLIEVRDRLVRIAARLETRK